MSTEEPKQPRLTHYQILKVDTTASSNEIKNGYHALARLHHPDRKRPERNVRCSSPSTDFLLIQTAWECLREDETRKLYDQSLFLQKHRVNLLYQNAVRLRPDECREVLGTNESSVLSGDDNHAVDDEDLYSELYYQCRCGSDINTSLIAAPSTGMEYSGYDPASRDIVHCPGCSLMYDVSLLYVDDNDHESVAYS